MSHSYENVLTSAKGDHSQFTSYYLTPALITPLSIQNAILVPKDPSYSIYCFCMLTLQDYVLPLMLFVMVASLLAWRYKNYQRGRMLSALSSEIYDDLL